MSIFNSVYAAMKTAVSRVIGVVKSVFVLVYHGLKNLGNKIFSSDRDIFYKEDSKPKTLNLRGSNITSQELVALLQTMPKLEMLDLSLCKSIGDINGLDINFDYIKTLDLSYSSITPQGLVALLNKMPRLKNLKLSYCEIGDINDLNINLDSLEELSLYGSTITPQGLVALLQKMPNLKILSLHECKSIGDINDLKINLYSIEKLSLKGSTITSQGLVALLQKMPNLKELTLSSCESIDDIYGLNINLDSIENLDLHGSTITSQGLVALLQKMPNLKTLWLHRCKSIGDINDLNINLDYIQSIVLNDSNITSQGLVALLNKMPKLENLDVSKCEKLTKAYYFGRCLNINLDFIKTVSFSHSSITPQGLSDLLQKMPNIQKLYLSQCLFINKLSDLNINLNFIETIFWDSIYFPTMQDLVTLLQKMPNLKKLESGEFGRRGYIKVLIKNQNGLPINEELKYNLFKLLIHSSIGRGDFYLRDLIDHGFKDSHDAAENCLSVRKWFYRNSVQNLDFGMLFEKLYGMLRGDVRLNAQSLLGYQKFIEDGKLRVFMHKNKFSILEDDINSPNERQGNNTPLTWAAKNKLPGMVSRLVANGADIKQKDDSVLSLESAAHSAKMGICAA